MDNPNSGKSSLYSFEEIQCRNEIRKIMDAPEPDFNKGKNLIFKLAKLKYSHIYSITIDRTSKPLTIKNVTGGKTDGGVAI